MTTLTSYRQRNDQEIKDALALLLAVLMGVSVLTVTVVYGF